MTPSATPHDPPRWAERLLRACLDPRDRDTIAGDLLEEYREVVRPARGRFGANLWYLTQVLSLVLSLNSGVTLGLVVGTGFGIANVIVTALAPLAEDTPGAMIAFYAPMVLLWGIAGFLAARRTGRISRAIKVSALAGGVTLAVFALSLFVRNNVFLDAIRERDDWRNMVASYQASGFGSLRAYANYVYLRGMPLVILIGTAIGAISGLIGGLTGRFAR